MKTTIIGLGIFLTFAFEAFSQCDTVKFQEDERNISFKEGLCIQLEGFQKLDSIKIEDKWITSCNGSVKLEFFKKGGDSILVKLCGIEHITKFNPNVDNTITILEISEF
jgi:hypothetical protein